MKKPCYYLFIIYLAQETFPEIDELQLQRITITESLGKGCDIFRSRVIYYFYINPLRLSLEDV